MTWHNFLEPVAEALLEANLSRAEVLPSVRIAAERALRLAADDRGQKISARGLRNWPRTSPNEFLITQKSWTWTLCPQSPNRRGLPAAMAARLFPYSDASKPGHSLRRELAGLLFGSHFIERKMQ